MIHRGGWLGAPIMIRNTLAVPVGIPLGVYALFNEEALRVWFRRRMADQKHGATTPTGECQPRPGRWGDGDQICLVTSLARNERTTGTRNTLCRCELRRSSTLVFLFSWEAGIRPPSRFTLRRDLLRLWIRAESGGRFARRSKPRTGPRSQRANESERSWLGGRDSNPDTVKPGRKKGRFRK